MVQSSPTTPPTLPRDDAEIELLRRFVHARDVHCPRCDYNLRGQTGAACPECREELRLSIGFTRPRLHWLILALTPGVFSGIAAFFLLGMIIMAGLSPKGRVPWQPYVIDAFGWLSGLFAATVFLQRHRFLASSNEWQRVVVGLTWFAHIAFFFSIWVLW